MPYSIPCFCRRDKLVTSRIFAASQLLLRFWWGKWNAQFPACGIISFPNAKFLTEKRGRQKILRLCRKKTNHTNRNSHRHNHPSRTRFRSQVTGNDQMIIHQSLEATPRTQSHQRPEKHGSYQKNSRNCANHNAHNVQIARGYFVSFDVEFDSFL